MDFPLPYGTYHQAALNRSAIFACMVFRMIRHLRCLWCQIYMALSLWRYGVIVVGVGDKINCAAMRMIAAQ